MIQTLLCRLLQLYLIVMFARIILSWFPLQAGSMMASVYGFLYAVTEPVLGPIRRVIPPIGAGGMGLDLSPLVVFFGITILQGAIC
ncbi:MAG: YggT family protein [Actinomycetota bacterium]|nr:YggT family protein [Actinomycetota bacterium]